MKDGKMMAAGTAGRVDRIFRWTDSIWEHSRWSRSLAAFLFSIFLSRPWVYWGSLHIVPNLAHSRYSAQSWMNFLQLPIGALGSHLTSSFSQKEYLVPRHLFKCMLLLLWWCLGKHITTSPQHWGIRRTHSPWHLCTSPAPPPLPPNLGKMVTRVKHEQNEK